MQPESRHRRAEGLHGADRPRARPGGRAGRPPLRERRAAARRRRSTRRCCHGRRRRRSGCGPSSDPGRPRWARCASAATCASCIRATATAWSGATWSRPSGCPTGTVTRPSRLRPGGESWSEFVERASGAVRAMVREHPGELVVAAVHAGVIEATMIAFLGVAPEVYRRGWVRIVHASMTEWEWVPSEDRFVLLRFNDSCGVPRRAEGRVRCRRGRHGPGPRARRQARHPRSPHAGASWRPRVAARGRRRSRRSAGW